MSHRPEQTVIEARRRGSDIAIYERRVACGCDTIATMIEQPVAAPQNKGLEDLGVALMSVLGYYVTSSLVDRPYGDSEVLEIDALAIRVGPRAAGGTQRVLVEAKSGERWGYSDVFKLLGQKQYTSATHALLLVSGGGAERAGRVDRRFSRFDLHAIHVAGSVADASSWTLWQQLADRGLSASPACPDLSALSAASAAATRRRKANEFLASELKRPGHSVVLIGAGHLVKSLNDATLNFADPSARLLALWALRDEWRDLRRQAAEEEAQGPGASGVTQEGNNVLAAASNRARRYPLVQALMLVALRAQLEILLALTELTVSGGRNQTANPLPPALLRAGRDLSRTAAPEALPVVAQQLVWHWGGILRSHELTALALEAALPADEVFRLLQVAAELFKDWQSESLQPKGINSKDLRRHLHARTRVPVFRVSSVPAIVRLGRRQAAVTTDGDETAESASSSGRL